MSSSSKKKLRKEQAAANMTEKQLAAQKEEKQLKVYTASFWIVLVLCVCLVAGMALKGPVIGMTRMITTAATVNDLKLSAVELNYFYIDAINNYCNQYSSYLSYFLDTSKPIGEQFYDEEGKITWADEFLDMALESAKNNYALYNAAKAAGHTLTEEEQESTKELFSQLKTAAKSYGYNTSSGYLKALYGKGASLSSYKAYYEVTALASSYYQAYTKQLSDAIDNDALRDYEADKMYEFNSYTYASYYMNVDCFKEGGTKDDKGNVTYSDEEIKAAEAAVKAAAEALAVPENNTLEALNAAIAASTTTADAATKDEATKDEATKDEAKKVATATENKDVKYSGVNSSVQEWIRDDARKEGDIAALPYTTTSTVDGKEVETLKGYYVVLFQSVNDNVYALKDVRHILVGYEGGTTDENGSKTYSDAEKNAAKEKAEAILKDWEAGAKTEDSFAELAKEKSTDAPSKENGGLYEAVYPGQMVAPFEDWCYDETRKEGDTGIVQSDYGYHVMYFSGDNETTYRDYMVKNALLEEQTTEWQEALNEATVVTALNTKHIDRDMVLGGGNETGAEEDHEGHDH